MIIEEFDPHRPLRYVRYKRMSTDMQNERSPQQQADEIDRTRERRGYDQWVFLKDYVDEGISGRYLRKRPGFSQMLDEIRSGLIKPDAILVDTLERFGRVEDLPAIRRELHHKYGVLILTADTEFGDPTSNMGQVYGTMEAMRASAASKTKAHDVLRGKLDVALRRRWPGSTPPTGMMLIARTETLIRKGKSVENTYHLLGHDPATKDVPQRLFTEAFTHGWGPVRITRAVNIDTDFVARHGKLNCSLVAWILRNPIYKGVLRFNRLATDVRGDCRVVRKKPQEEVLYIAEFCDPLVPAEIWDKVNKDMDARGTKLRALAAARKNPDGKQIMALNPGLILRYPLTGLVRCALCGAAMRPGRSGAKNPNASAYYYYRCPNSIDGRCANHLYLRGPWLWQVVVATLREQLFPLPGSNDTPPAWLGEIVGHARQALTERLALQQDQRPALEAELRNLNTQIGGWTLSLSQAELPVLARRQLETQFQSALERKQACEATLQSLASQVLSMDELFDPQKAVECIRRLETILERGSPSDINVELSLHIESIRVHPDGHVVLRSHRFGVFEGVARLLAGNPATLPAPVATGMVRPRVLSLRNTTLPSSNGPLKAADGLIEDPVHLPDQWVDQKLFQMPQYQSWAKQKAQEVLAYHQANPSLSLNKVAKHFGRSRPTIQQALAKAQYPEDITPPQRRRRPSEPKITDFRSIAEEVGLLYHQVPGLTIKAIAQQMGVSRGAVTRALDYWYDQRSQRRPDLRGQRRGQSSGAPNNTLET